jgi:hypothetical protein
MMKIEGDIVEEFVRHWLQFVDRLIVVDLGCLDTGREILGDLVAEGLPISIWEGEPFPATDERRTTLVRRAFETFEPDYLFLLDVDEFLKAPSRSELESVLAALNGVHAVVPWVTYVPAAGDPAGESRVLARVRHRLALESTQFFKVVVHRSIMGHENAFVTRGNHAIVDDGVHVPLALLPGIGLAHFPVRSLRQVQTKALLGWPSSLATGSHEAPGTDFQWQLLNDRLLRGLDWSEADFLQSAWNYLNTNQDAAPPELVLDPLPPIECRYDRPYPELLTIAVRFSRQLALTVWSARTASRSETPPGVREAEPLGL